MIVIDWIFITHTEIAWLLYACLCFPCVYFILWRLPKRLLRTYTLDFIFFYLLTASIFIFGLLIAILLAFSLFYIKPAIKKKKIIALADFPEYQQAPTREMQHFGEGFAYKTIKNPHMPKLIREKMLIALNQFGTSSVNQINMQMLTDETDEIRLYAQSLIEKQERNLSKDIKKFSRLLEKARQPLHIALYQKQIAHAWWEEVYKFLINQENVKSILDKIEYHALEAFKILPKDTDLPILLAKVALKRNQPEVARDWLLIAKENEAPLSKTEPFLAEIAYNEKNYSEVKKILANKKLQGVIGIYPFVHFWTHI